MVTNVVIPWSEGEVSGRLAGSGDVGILLAHGAGSDQDHPLMTGLRDGLAENHTVLTFNYPYAERGSKRPDRPERLLACHRGAAGHLGSRVESVYYAGRSMGGRMASYLVAEGDRVAGLVLYAYPLHPAGRPEKLRVHQFPEIRVPMLFFQGTRDPMARMDLFEREIAPLGNAQVETLPGAGHGPRSGGWTVEKMIDRYVGATVDWIARVSSGTSAG